MEPMDLQSLWMCRACGSVESVDPWSPWIHGACGSVEPLDLWSLWIHGAQDLQSLSYWGCGSCIVDPVEPLVYSL